MKGSVKTGSLIILAIVTYLAVAEDSATKDAQTVYTNLTETNWKEYFFGNATDGDHIESEGRNRQGKDFFDFIGLGTGPETDPYLAKANNLCLTGDLSECFKSRALSSLDEFFTKEGYYVTENVRVVRMSDEHLRRVLQEGFEFSSTPRVDESEWEQFVKFLLRKIERFVKSTAIEVKVPEELTEGGRYSPRFVNEIASELDVIEDKKAGVVSCNDTRVEFPGVTPVVAASGFLSDEVTSRLLVCDATIGETFGNSTLVKPKKKPRYKLKKLFIPLLIILKLFQIKLLLFLPMILGIASFKKLLGFLAIVIPGMIGVFKLCKPQLYSTSFGNGHASYYQPPKYTPAGIGHGSPQYYSHHVPYNPSSYGYGPEHHEYTGYSSHLETGKAIKSSSGSVAFRDDAQGPDYSQNLAYSSHRSAKNS